MAFYGDGKHNENMEYNIYHFDDWVEYTMEFGSGFTLTELMEFREHYQNLLDYEANILHFITFKLNKTVC
jgi:hypothetical protein